VRTGNKWSESKLVPYRELLSRLRTAFPSLERLTDGPNDTSKVTACMWLCLWVDERVRMQVHMYLFCPSPSLCTDGRTSG
jgi:hypothetical protein